MWNYSRILEVVVHLMIICTQNISLSWYWYPNWSEAKIQIHLIIIWLNEIPCDFNHVNYSLLNEICASFTKIFNDSRLKIHRTCDIFVYNIIITPPRRVAEYCDKRVCLQGRGDGPETSKSWTSESARMKAELDCWSVLPICLSLRPVGSIHN